MRASQKKLTLCEAALDYAEQGLFVLPAKGKAPLIAGGFTSASNDPEQVQCWWEQWPKANIGIACDASDLVVLDVDKRSGGFTTLDELELRCELPMTPCSHTGGDGLHAFFRYPGVGLKGRLPGIDIKHHGYVIAPPSIHQSGKRYEWIIDFDHPVSSIPGPWLETLSRANNESNTDLLIQKNPQCGPHSETDVDWLKEAERLGDWSEKDVDWLDRLPDRLLCYLRLQPERGWRQTKKTRSELEAQIVYRWVCDGASDRQIIELADACLPKHIEEKWQRGNDYIQRTIDNMRRWAYNDQRLISSPGGGKPRKRDAKYRRTSTDTFSAALALADGQEHADWIRQLESCGMSRATAYRNSKRLRESGLITRVAGRVEREGSS